MTPFFQPKETLDIDLIIVAIVASVKSPESDWQKVDYLMEFGEWLFVNEYPVADALDQVSEL